MSKRNPLPGEPYGPRYPAQKYGFGGFMSKQADTLAPSTQQPTDAALGDDDPRLKAIRYGARKSPVVFVGDDMRYVLSLLDARTREVWDLRRSLEDAQREREALRQKLAVIGHYDHGAK